MDDDNLTSFQRELGDIQGRIVRMAAHVTESIPRGTEALLESDLQLAQALIDDDDVLDAQSIELEEQCYKLLALRQPVATDLRLITGALVLNSEIERSGDLMVNVAKATRRVYGSKFGPRLRGVIVQMSEEAGRLFRLAIDAYVDSNAGLAAALDDIDDRLDDLNRDCVQAIFEAHTNGDLDLLSAVQLALISRYYERIGDHAVNIGERVVYVVTGWLPEHAGAARHTSRRAGLGQPPATDDPGPEDDA